MTEEIKEILDYIDDKIIQNEKWDKIKDYITNLQQELEKANDTIKELRDNKALELVKISINSQYINTQNENIRLKEELEDYKSRCEKANKWVDKHTEIYTENGISIIDWDNLSDPRKLKNILNGSDEK